MTARSSLTLPLAGGVLLGLDGVADDNAAVLDLAWPDGRQERRQLRAYRPTLVGDLWIVQLNVGPALAARATSGEQPLRVQSLSVEGDRKSVV